MFHHHGPNYDTFSENCVRFNKKVNTRWENTIAIYQLSKETDDALHKLSQSPNVKELMVDYYIPIEEFTEQVWFDHLNILCNSESILCIMFMNFSSSNYAFTDDTVEGISSAMSGNTTLKLLQTTCIYEAVSYNDEKFSHVWEIIQKLGHRTALGGYSHNLARCSFMKSLEDRDLAIRSRTKSATKR